MANSAQQANWLKPGFLMAATDGRNKLTQEATQLRNSSVLSSDFPAKSLDGTTAPAEIRWRIIAPSKQHSPHRHQMKYKICDISTQRLMMWHLLNISDKLCLPFCRVFHFDYKSPLDLACIFYIIQVHRAINPIPFQMALSDNLSMFRCCCSM